MVIFSSAGALEVGSRYLLNRTWDWHCCILKEVCGSTEMSAAAKVDDDTDGGGSVEAAWWP